MMTRLIPCGVAFWLCLVVVSADESAVWAKLEEWKVPAVDFHNTELGEAVAWVRAKSREIDPVATGRKAGLLLGYERRRHWEPDRLITLKAENISLGDLLTVIGKQANRTVEIHEDGVVLRVPGAIPVIEGMAERTYRVPTGFLYWANHAADDEAADPFAGGKPSPARAPQTAKSLLEMSGITFPEGAAARLVHDSNGELLVLTNTPDQLELIDALLLSEGRNYPRQLRIQAEIYAMDTAKALALARDADNPAGAALLLREIGDRVAAGEAELVGSPMLMTRSGQRGRIGNGTGRQIVTGYTEKDGKDAATTERVLAGTSMEVDAVIGADGFHIEMTIAIEVGAGEPKFSRTEILAPVSGQRVPVESVESKGTRIQTSATAVDGVPQLIGVTPSGPGSGKSLLVFATATILEVRAPFPVPE